MRDTDTTRRNRRPESESDRALTRHRAWLRRAWFVYSAAFVVILVVVGAGVRLAYSHGDLGHVTVITASHPPVSVSPQATHRSLARLWGTADTTAVGVPFVGGTVVTHDAHTVRGRDAESGAVTWSYTRSNRSVCAAVQSTGVTVAIYRSAGKCDELTGLDSQSGQRRWTRTLDENGEPFNGTEPYQVLGDEIMFVSPDAIYAISNAGNQYAAGGNGGIDYWMFRHPGCSIGRAVLGSSGALISQVCHDQQCAGLILCRNGEQLLLRPRINPVGVSDEQKRANPDYLVWNIPDRASIPTSAGSSVTSLDQQTHQLSVRNAKTGATEVVLAVRATAKEYASPSDVETSDADVLWLDGITYVLRKGSKSFAWQTPTTNAPTISPPPASDVPDSVDQSGSAVRRSWRHCNSPRQHERSYCRTLHVDRQRKPKGLLSTW